MADKYTPITRGARDGFLEQMSLIAGAAPKGSRPSGDELLHLLCAFYNLRSMAYLSLTERACLLAGEARKMLRQRGASGKAADLMVQRAMWEQGTSLITLVDDVICWSDLKQARGGA